MNIFVIEGWIILAVILIALAVKVFAFVNALMWPAEAYSAASKLTKPGWLAILGVGLAAQAGRQRAGDAGWPSRRGAHSTEVAVSLGVSSASRSDRFFFFLGLSRISWPSFHLPL